MHEIKNSEISRPEIPVALIAGHMAVQEGVVAPHVPPTEQSAEAELAQEQKMAQAEEWLDRAEDDEDYQAAPTDIASLVSILAQKRVNSMSDDDVMSDSYFKLIAIRDNAVNAADELDFELVELSRGNWPLHARLNAMHEKFKKVSVDALTKFLGTDYGKYEYRALFIRDIIVDHAPALLTEDLKTMLDPSQPLWRTSSIHASILLRNAGRTNVDDMLINQIPTALPVGGRLEYATEDSEVMKSVAAMSDEELMLYVRPDAIADVRERGRARFDECLPPIRETILTRRLFETTGKSHDPEARRAAGERNKAFEDQPVFQEGDFVHATSSTEVLDAVLSNGLRCGESVMGNGRAIIKYPFTVSMLEVTQEIAGAESVAEKLDLLKNGAYGAINLVLHRGGSATPQIEGQKDGVPNQRQIFGGIPSTEIKSIVIRDQEATEQTIAKVIQAVVKNGMFIPVYKGSTGELLLTSEQFDQLSVNL